MSVTSPSDEPKWFVCHTKPRCEKRFAQLMEAENFEHYLPLTVSVRRYGTRTKKFTKPLFPSYVFACFPPSAKPRAHQRDHLVRVIPVENEALFLQQIEAIKTLLASGLEISLHPPIEKGTRVKVIAGPLWGVEAIVDNPDDPKGIIIAVDILQQGVLTRIQPEFLKVIDS